MADELKHASPGIALTQEEYEAVSGHTVNDGVKGDRLYFDGTYIKREESPWVNVKHYGAVGDGVTNDTVAINAAIAALPRTPIRDTIYGTLYFPRGRYRHLGITISADGGVENLIIQGEGSGRPKDADHDLLGSTLIYDGSAREFGFGIINAETMKGFTIRDIGFEGNASLTNAVLQLVYCNDVHVSNVFCGRGTAAAGVFLSYVNRAHFFNLHSWGNNYGVSMDRSEVGKRCGDVSFYGCTLFQNIEAAVIGAGDQIGFYSTDMEAGNYGIRMSHDSVVPTGGLVLHNCHWEDIDTTPIELGGTSYVRGVSIVGNQIFKAGAAWTGYGMKLTVQDCLVAGNHFNVAAWPTNAIFLQNASNVTVTANNVPLANITNSGSTDVQVTAAGKLYLSDTAFNGSYGIGGNADGITLDKIASGLNVGTTGASAGEGYFSGAVRVGGSTASITGGVSATLTNDPTDEANVVSLGNRTGLLLILHGSGKALFLIHSSTVVEIADVANNHTTTKGTASNINVYVESGVPKLQNLSGGALNVRWQWLGSI